MSHSPLSPIDYVYAMGAYEPISFVLTFENRLEADRVVAAFKQAVGRFHGLGGVLVQLDRSTLAFDLSNDASVVEACNESANDTWHEEIARVRTRIGEPLVRARVTQLRNAGTRISLVMSHGVGDGYSFFLFLAAWAASARGEAGFEPVNDRSALSVPEMHAPEGQRWSGELEHSGFVVDDARTVREHRALLPIALDDKLLTKPDSKLSMNDWLCAVVWKHTLTATSGSTTLCTLADLRRFRANLGPLYFGNAILPAKLAMDVEALRKASATSVAEQVRSAVEGVAGRIEKAMSELQQLRAAEGLEVFKRVRPTDSAGITVTNMARAPYEALDFGRGLPVTIEPIFSPLPDRCVFVLPNRGQSGLRFLTTI